MTSTKSCNRRGRRRAFGGNSGIYQVRNIVTNERYIGLTKNFSARRADHFRLLRHGCHPSRKMQESYRRHGVAAFQFEVLEQIEGGDELLRRLTYAEEEHVLRLRPEFNPTPGGDQSSAFTSTTSPSLDRRLDISPSGRVEILIGADGTMREYVRLADVKDLLADSLNDLSQAIEQSKAAILSRKRFGDDSI